MKKINLLLLLSSSVFANNQYISLPAGSSATIFAGMETTVSCQGPAASSVPKYHCKCVKDASGYYGISHEELGLLTNPTLYSSIYLCNEYLNKQYKKECIY